jgi:hypothetical protein
MKKNRFPEKGWYTRGTTDTLYYWDGLDWTTEEEPYDKAIFEAEQPLLEE